MDGRNVDEAQEEFERQIIGFFDQGILAYYRDQPDKYVLETDYFEGRLKTTSQYARECEANGADDEYIDVRFGYRTLQNGDLALAVFLPDLFNKSKGHLARWTGFFFKEPVWASQPDERFTLWRRRYLDGDWGVDNGSLFYLLESVQSINALTTEAVGRPLFKFAANPALNYPSAQNTHRYQDAHRELYNYLIDGLDKETIGLIAAKVGNALNISSDRTVAALKRALPGLPATSRLWQAFDVVSAQRREAGHAVRPPAQRFAAFEEFNSDLDVCLAGMRELLAHLEEILDMDSDTARRRQESKEGLPKIARPAMKHFSISQLPQAVGKTIERVEFGFRQDIQGVHESEAAIIYFTDGSILGIDTGSNIMNLTRTHEGLKPEEVSIDFRLQWISPPKGAQ